MAAKKMTREEIIELINQYIYTNGLQRITAAQLHTVLTEIAVSYAIEGGASGGIDAVLETGSTVSEGRVITNEFGGTLNLSGEMEIGDDQILKYIGMTFNHEQKESIMYVGNDKVIIGNRRIENPVPPSRSAQPPASSVASGDAFLDRPDMSPLNVLTIYNLAAAPVIENKAFEGKMGADAESFPEGITSVVSNNRRTSNQSIDLRGIRMTIDDTGILADEDGTVTSLSSNFNLTGKGANIYVSSGGEQYANMSISTNAFLTYIQNGPQTSSHNQSPEQFNWDIQGKNVVRINAEGLILDADSKLLLSPGGSAPTSGLATLSGGTVSVETSAVKANSVISLTVQETGAFTGNIRVSAKTPGSGFKIISTQDADTCEVFWQIIDLLAI